MQLWVSGTDGSDAAAREAAEGVAAATDDAVRRALQHLSARIAAGPHTHSK
eukprot:gene12210-46568_t